jgi:1-acyl-sn-glycerol-3-phosphate acyltransferase
MKRRPDPMPRTHRWRTNVIQVPMMAASTIVCGSLSLLSSLFDRSGRVQHRIAHIWARSLLWCSGCPLTVNGAENLRKYPVVVFAANHTSYMDTPVVFGALDCQFRILAMKKLWPVPIIGWWLNRSGQIPIDMTNPGATLSSLGAAIKALRAGMPLFIFPEGGRTTDGALQPFLSGAAFLAIRAQVPVVPIALSGVFDLLPPHTRHFYPSALTMSVGEPIVTVGMNLRQMDDLTERVKGAIAAMMEEQAEPALAEAPMALASSEPGPAVDV